MPDQEQMLDFTQAYLRSVISEVSSSLSRDFDPLTPFMELGMDSFHVLKVVKRLEADFGSLPKTLLFENFTVDDLAHYFVKQHERIIAAKFSRELRSSAHSPEQRKTPIEASATRTVNGAASLTAVESSTTAHRSKGPTILSEKEAHADPVWGELIREVFHRYKNESSVSRGTRIIAPFLFIGGERRGYFHVSRGKGLILAYAYTGPEDYFRDLAREIHQYCTRRKLQLNILVDLQIKSVGEIPFSATPFGAVQRVLDLPKFSLRGSRMRRLRYQVSRFKQARDCRTEEYCCGSDRETDRSIVGIIDQWCNTRTMVNPLVHVAREEILAGTLSREHRVFLTYIGETLQNAIIISPLSSEQNGYLMDLEFYPPGMPLGGLEFAIVNIIETLVSEGCTMLSLGATLGTKLAPSSNADPGVDRILDDLREQNIFNDQGNLQFKNKFRPDNKTIFLCRPAGSGDPDNVTDIIMMIADPARTQTWDVDQIHLPPKVERIEPEEEEQAAEAAAGKRRAVILSDHGYNPLNVPPDEVAVDLKTDSWSELRTKSIDEHMRNLHLAFQQSASVEESLREIFPFSHFVLTSSGRAAEDIFCRAWPRKGIVLQNLLFPTTIYHQIDKGFTPTELPRAETFQLDSDERFKGELDWDVLRMHAERAPDAIAFVCVEVNNNAAGGYPVSMQHLKNVRTFLSEHAVPLVIDGTRTVGNARFLMEHDREYASKDIWEVVQELLSCADVVVASLTKEFCVSKGGVIATNDAELFSKLDHLVQEEASGLDIVDKKLIAVSLQNRQRIAAQVTRRMDCVRSVSEALTNAGVPIVQPAGGHCVLIDVKRVPEFQSFKYPVASFLAWMYLNTGIRAAAHNAGMQKNTAINGLVRLAIPVGFAREQLEATITKLVRLFETKANIPELLPDGEPSAPFGSVSARFRLQKYHNPAVSLIAGSSDSAPSPEEPGVRGQTGRGGSIPALERTSRKGEPCSVRKRQSGREGGIEGRRRTRDIAIVGAAGRYPEAKNLRELWNNLTQGRDCIRDVPESRMEQRRHSGRIAGYRGGFIDDIDKFDSLFFNISPREAEMLDPQERLFLEVAWEAIEDAGYYPETLVPEGAPRDVAVFVGAVWAMYQIIGVEEKLAGRNINPNSFLWSIANRVSYWMNFCGPSLTVDTACSSSLTALYLACEALHKGECSAAIVGGVNLDLHQSKYDINRAGGALSRDGVCRSFGQGANGYVAGEGVGAILLKPLERAIQDNDNIQGVIKSAVVNHGGRTSGYTVPNSKAQAQLISQALHEAQIDARTVGYIEAHGTGTELGDPIELAGLTEAFQAHGAGKQTCAVGSIKSNIGHLEAAAGVVSVCKVLLQMKHRRLVPSLHSSKLNEHIDFDNSPFYVQQESGEWKAKELNGVLYPLRAGISSFGAGGSNAHVILEEYQRPEQKAAQPRQQVVPLSANTEQQLREAAIRLHQHIQDDLSGNARDPQLDIADIAYTLQIGRKSFDHRLAVLAATKEELVEKLRGFIEGRQQTGVLHGNAEGAARIAKLLSRAGRKQFLELLSSQEQPHRLAEIWTEGLLVDWVGHQERIEGRRISLPTYPFANKRHWARHYSRATRPSLPAQSGLHPLIDSNESTFERQLFKKTFNADEFFIYDHHVSGIPTLPGVAYLELARKAGELAAGRRVRTIRNIVWVSPLTVVDSAPTQAFIDLKPAGDSVQFEVFSEGDDGSKRLYSQGKLTYGNEHEPATEPEYVDLDSIRARCTKVSDGRDIYPVFKSLGLNLGPSFQVLQEVFRSDTEVLGALRLPDGAAWSLQEFMLHPSLVDGSFQAGMAGHLGGKANEMFVPYSIGEVEILHPLPQTCFSYVTEGRGKENAGAKLARSNVLILDDEGKILVKVRDSVGVPLLDVHGKAAQNSGQELYSMLYYSHVWEKAPLDEAAVGRRDAETILLFDSNDRLRNVYRDRSQRKGQDAGNVILVLPGAVFRQVDQHTYQIDPANPEHYPQLIKSLDADRLRIERVCFAWVPGPSSLEDGMPDGDSLRASLERGIYPLLFFCQSLVNSSHADKVQILYLHRGNRQEPEPQDQAVNGFASTLHLEYPKLSCKTVHLQDQDTTPDEVLDVVLAEFHPNARGAMSVRYRDGERYRRKVESFDLEGEQDSDRPVALKENGIYLITGGVGGLAHVFAEFLARECKARLVLNGRSALNPEIEARLGNLREAGAKEALYLPGDVSRPEDVRKLVAGIKSHFGAIDGIIHMAGVLRDSYIKDKVLEDFDAVLAPKVFGTVNLDAATKSEDLDFLVLFSSMSALGGNPGQCDYAFANHFMDSFAATRTALRANGTRSGKTLSINWSIWADGGMTVDEQTDLYMRKNLGIKPLDKEAGLDAFARGLGSSKCQFAVVEGVREKVEKAWGLRAQEVPAESSEEAASRGTETGATAGELPALVQNGLAGIVMEFLKLDAEDISFDKILLDLGFDSIGLATYANLINEKYQLDITPVLFFEYPSIREIAKYLSMEHADAVLRVHAASRAMGTPAAEEPISTPATEAQTSPEGRPVPSFGINKGSGRSAVRQPVGGAGTAESASPRNRFAEQPIAIVGMSGVMPQSENLEEFWENLAAGRNLVTTIPKDRWKWEEYDGDPLTEINKTNSRWGGFMKEVDKFDPLFFGISPREAELMDPQQRIFLETVWKAVEDSGHKVSDLWGTRTGLFVGVATNDYVDLMTRGRIPVHAYASTGNSHSVLANRVSYLLNLRGPSAPLDTACSSSLIAIHRAVESIHTGSCDMAIVGGVQVMTSPTGYIAFGQAGMLSSDGKCKTFDKRANGYVRGEGSGAIFLKPLAMAQADRDPIHAVIKATAENHGGKGAALTAPNPGGQSDLLIEAFENAQVDPGTIGYIECHGTGTSLGDPIEIQALKKSFAELYKRYGRAQAKAPHCGLSSVKTNIGHLETAAGIAGVLKALLAIKHKQIPALIHFEEINPYIDLKGSPFYIVDRTRSWEAPTDESGTALPRKCGVSSFGFGGANAHVVLEEYVSPESPYPVATQIDSAVVLSARSGDRLDAYARTLLAHLRKHTVGLTDLAYTLQAGRDAMEERVGFLVSSVEQLTERLQAFVDGVPGIEGLYRGNAKRKSESTSLLHADESGRQAVIDQYLADRNLSKLLGLWVDGLDLDWNELYGEIKPHRVSLPTYPFARQSYWIDTSTSTERGQAEVPAPATNADRGNRDRAGTSSLIAVPVWQSSMEPGSSGAISWQSAKHYILICEMPGIDDERLEAMVPRSRCVALKEMRERDVPERYRQAAWACLELIQSIFRAGPNEQALIQVVIPDTPDNACLCGLSGLLRTAVLENGRLAGQVILTRPENTTDELARQLKDALARPHDVMLKYEGGIRKVLTWEPIAMCAGSSATELPQKYPFREDGVYLITGGLGGLGVLFAGEILKRAGRTKLILTGRSNLSAAKQSLIAGLSAGAGQVEYRQVDVADPVQVENLIAAIGKRHSALNGILHCAGTVAGRLIVKKTLDEFNETLAPKVRGTVNLDEAARECDLDFLVLFSSISSAMGMHGLADYAAANAFMDEFAAYRNRLVLRGKRRGKTVSINWPLWQEGGMTGGKLLQEEVRRETGMQPLTSATGISAFYRSLELPHAQAVVMEGDADRMLEWFQTTFQRKEETQSAFYRERQRTGARQGGNGSTISAGEPPAGGNTGITNVSDFTLAKLTSLVRADLQRLQEGRR